MVRFHSCGDDNDNNDDGGDNDDDANDDEDNGEDLHLPAAMNIQLLQSRAVSANLNHDDNVHVKMVMMTMTNVMCVDMMMTMMMKTHFSESVVRKT